jgi:hypothetical protein
MDGQAIATILWITAAVVLVPYIMRRRSRKTKPFK